MFELKVSVHLLIESILSVAFQLHGKKSSDEAPAAFSYGRKNRCRLLFRLEQLFNLNEVENNLSKIFSVYEFSILVRNLMEPDNA